MVVIALAKDSMGRIRVPISGRVGVVKGARVLAGAFFLSPLRSFLTFYIGYLLSDLESEVRMYVCEELNIKLSLDIYINAVIGSSDPWD